MKHFIELWVYWLSTAWIHLLEASWQDIRKKNFYVDFLFFSKILLDREITLKILGFILNSREKVKPCFLLSQCVCFLNRKGQNSDLTAFTSKIQLFCRPEWIKGRTSWKWIFDNFEIQKWISQTVRAQKVDEKNGAICLVYFFPSWGLVLKGNAQFIFLTSSFR